MSKKLFLNSVSGTLLYFISIIVAFIMSPVLIKALGNRDYGLWELVMSVIGYMGLLDLGIGSALVRFVAVADGADDRKDLQQIMSTALAFFLVVGVVALLIFVLLGISPGIIAGTETKDIANVSTVFFLLGLNAALIFPLQVYITVLMGLQRHYFINSTRAIIAIIRAVVAYKLLYLYPGKGLMILALMEPIINVIQFILYAGLLWCDQTVPRISVSSISWHKMRELLGFGAKSATMLIASRLQNQSVPLIIGNAIGLGSIVYFVIPNRLIDYAKGFSLAVGFPITPYFSARTGREDQEELRTSWFSTTLILQLVSLPMPLYILFCGEKFISLWIGAQYAITGRWVMYYLLIGLTFDSLATNAYRILTAKALHGKCAAGWLALSVLSIPLGFIGAYYWGIEGAVFGTIGVTVLGNVMTLALACSVMHVAYDEYLKETTFKLLVPLSLLAAALWLIGEHSSHVTYLALLLQCVISAIIYFLAIWLFTLSGEIKKVVLNKVITLKFCVSWSGFVRSWR